MADEKLFKTFTARTGTLDNEEVYRHPLTFLLEAADDIAYATADLEDGYKKGLFSLKALQEFILAEYNDNSSTMGYRGQFSKELFDELDNILNAAKSDNCGYSKAICNPELHAVQNWIRYVQGWFLYVAHWRFESRYNNIMSGKYSKDLLYGTNHQYSMEILKKATQEFIFPNPSILKLELAAETILSGLLERFVHAVLYFEPNKKLAKEKGGIKNKLPQIKNCAAY